MSIELPKNRHGMPYEHLFITKTYVRPGGIIHRKTTLDGLLHTGPFDDEPSSANYDPDGNPMNFTWHEAGVEHRANGPSRIVFHEGTNRPATEAFRINGKPRVVEDGPHRIRRNLDGTIRELEYVDGSVTRPNSGSPSLDP